MSRRIIMAVALSLVLVAPRSFAAQETGKVGVVDSGKIFQQLPEAKQAETSLQAAAGPLQKEIAMKNQELQRAIAEYQKQAPKLTPAARNAKEKELNVKRRRGKEVRPFGTGNNRLRFPVPLHAHRAFVGF